MLPTTTLPGRAPTATVLDTLHLGPRIRHTQFDETPAAFAFLGHGRYGHHRVCLVYLKQICTPLRYVTGFDNVFYWRVHGWTIRQPLLEILFRDGLHVHGSRNPPSRPSRPFLALPTLEMTSYL